MNVLAFDTCFGACSAAVGVALGTNEARVEGVFELRDAGHAERLLPMVRAALESAGRRVGDLDRIAVTIGPGTFTGTRIGIAAARALAIAAGKPLVAATSLAVMARQAADEIDNSHGENLLVAVDARRGVLYAQLFRPDGWGALTPPQLLSPADAGVLGSDPKGSDPLADPFTGVDPLLVVGSGAEAVAAEARAGGRMATAALMGLLPDARALLQLAPRLKTLDAPPRPLYLRDADAKPQNGYAAARM